MQRRERSNFSAAAPGAQLPVTICVTSQRTSTMQQACKRRLRTLYVRMPDLFMDREERLSAGISEKKLLKKYARYDVLVVDEWLIDPLNPDQMRSMSGLVDRRSDAASTIWCSQYPVPEWHQRLGGGTHADAILDRIVHNATMVDTGDVNMRELTSCGTKH